MTKSSDTTTLPLVIGRLHDLRLGNPEGIPSKHAVYSSDQLEQTANKLQTLLVDPTELTALACIDGRHPNRDLDDKPLEIRMRRVGATAANLPVAMNPEAPIIKSLPVRVDLTEHITEVDEYIATQTGFERSAHTGGCGGANGEIEDNETIHQSDDLMVAVAAFMEQPHIKEYLEVSFDPILAERVRANAEVTAGYLREHGWQGQKYVESVIAESPHTVEELAVDVTDGKFMGEAEADIVIILGEKTITKDDEFVWNLEATKRIAAAFAAERGEEGYTQALIAEIAKHFATASRLASPETTLILIGD